MLLLLLLLLRTPLKTAVILCAFENIAAERRRREQRSVCERTGRMKVKFGSHIEKHVLMVVSHIREIL